MILNIKWIYIVLAKLNELKLKLLFSTLAFTMSIKVYPL